MNNIWRTEIPKGTSKLFSASYENIQLNHVFLFDNIGSKSRKSNII